ncbi:hypothetical protein BJ878DRAFT_291041 [Calycina marina]|uniref:Uncharacterized protein n=1 Tax=Calycina marina TaxID=1763456 RepID=A0A9P8CID5_9HELO|nr:hypothetical protein BJ878DRAFT_291041 [Calycina marina]
MSSFSHLISRSDSSSSTTMSSTMLNLLIALMVLVFTSILLVGALYIARKVRQHRAIVRQQLPTHNEKSQSSNPRSLTITTSPQGRQSSVYVYDEKSSMIHNPSSPPLSPDNVPEIRITFPDEHDESGRRSAGRVLVVRVGENDAHGLEPLAESNQLPAYQKDSDERFHSLDMDRIGGLKEESKWS